ncbi:MAG: T7SS effector LXG polymorphic toxin [Bacillus sp. (in: firmicutes)]
MKVLDVDALRHVIETTVLALKSQKNQLVDIENDIQAIVNLDQYLFGETGEAIKSFYNDFHIPFLRLLAVSVETYEMKLRAVSESLSFLEPGPNGLIREDFLDTDIEHALNMTRMMTIALTNETNLLLDSVKDLVELPKIQDNKLLESVNDAKTKRNAVLGQLDEFDYRATDSFAELAEDFTLLANYITQMKSMIGNGEIRILNPTNDHLKEQPVYQELLLEAQ